MSDSVQQPDSESSRRAADPFGVANILLTEEKDGPRMHLLRQNHGQGAIPPSMWIQFDEKPGRDIIEQLRQEGWRWENRAFHGENRGAWIMPIAEGSERQTHLEAERLFSKLANQIREANGLEPAQLSL